MNQADGRLEQLFELFLANKIGRDEYGEFWVLLEEGVSRNALSPQLRRVWAEAGSAVPVISDAEWDEKMKDRIKEFDNSTIRQFDNGSVSTGGIEVSENKVKRLKVWKWVAAASVIGLIAITYFILRQAQDDSPDKIEIASQEERFKNDVQPGTNAPVLVLGDGRVVNLDSAVAGSLAMEGDVSVVRDENGEIVYNTLRQALGDITQVRMNTINNPRGSKVVSLKLADGTKVWLDAASSITYPTAFVGDKRNVEITGQAYFEVVPASAPTFDKSTADKKATAGKASGKMPFLVQSGGVQVEVLGTHFNVMAFKDEEQIQVTLLEGAVAVKKGDNRKVISPGQSAFAKATADEAIRISNNVDIATVMAWKNGVFKFQDVGIEELMRQLARWYDVEVVYEGKPTDRFVSTIPRDVSATQVFKILETTGRVHFRIEGKKVVVMK